MPCCSEYIITRYSSIVTISRMLLTPPMENGPMKLKKLTLEIYGSRFSFPFIKYIEEGGAPLSTV